MPSFVKDNIVSNLNTVVILAYECHPYHRSGSTIGAQRPYQFAKYLSKFGWRAIVLCCDVNRRYSISPNSNWRSIVEKEITQRLKKWDQKQSLIIPLPSLHYADFIDRLWLSCVTITPINGTFTAKKGFIFRLVRKFTSLLKLFRGDHSQSWQDVALHSFEVLKKQGVSINSQVACHGPDASLYVAQEINRKAKINWVIDFRDPILQPIPRKFRKIYALYLKLKFSSVRKTVNVNTVWSNLDAKIFNKPVAVIENGFDQDEIKSSQNQQFSVPITIGYAGGIIRPFQKLDTFFKTLNNFSSDEIVFKYNGNAHDWVDVKAQEFNVKDKVETKGHIERLESLARLKEANFLLILSSSDPEDEFYKYGMHPGKFWEYLAIGKPIICFSKYKDHILERFISDTKSGFIFKDSEQASIFFRNWITDKLDKDHSDEDLLNRDFELIEKYSRKNLTAKMAQILNELMYE